MHDIIELSELIELIYHIGKKSSAKILVGKNKKSAKKLVPWTKFRHFLPTNFQEKITKKA